MPIQTRSALMRIWMRRIFEVRQSSINEVHPSNEVQEDRPAPYRHDEDLIYITQHELRRRENGVWSANFYAIMPAISSVIGTFSICRLIQQVIMFKGPFIFQFILLSLLLGIPTMIFSVIVGQYMGTGITDMWFISPAFKGIGVSLMYAYVIIGIYYTLPLSWIQIFLGDSAVHHRAEYKWSNCTTYAHECVPNSECSALNQIAFSLKYYSKYVAMELNVKPDAGPFIFNKCMFLFIFWFMVFCAVNRGLKVFSKMVCITNILGIFLFYNVFFKFVITWGHGMIWVMDAPWKMALKDPMQWAYAAKEVFLTWNLLGGITMHLSSHIASKKNIGRFILALLVSISCLLISIIIFASCLGYALTTHGANFVPTAMTRETEDLSTVSLLYKSCEPGNVSSNDTQKDFEFITYIAGDTFISRDHLLHSYMPLRAATELFPTLVAAEGYKNMPSIFPICFYTCLLLFGFSQVATSWMCFVESVCQLNPSTLSKWSSIITVLLTIGTFLIELPFTTMIGYDIVHFMDMCLSSAWWAMILFACMMVALCAIKGNYFDSTEFLQGVVINPKRLRVATIVFTIFFGIFLPLIYMIMASISMDRLNHAIHFKWPGWDGVMYFMTWFCESSPLILFSIVMVWMAISTINKKNSFRENIRDLFSPVLPMVRIPVQRRNRSSSNGTPEPDLPPNYTPPPSYSAAVGREIATCLSRSHSCSDLHNLSDASQLRFYPVNNSTLKNIQVLGPPSLATSLKTIPRFREKRNITFVKETGVLDAKNSHNITNDESLSESLKPSKSHQWIMNLSPKTESTAKSVACKISDAKSCSVAGTSCCKSDKNNETTSELNKNFISLMHNLKEIEILPPPPLYVDIFMRDSESSESSDSLENATSV